MRPDSSSPTDDFAGRCVELASHGRTVIYDRTNHAGWIASDDAVDLAEVR